jgi:hypothetical protein
MDLLYVSTLFLSLGLGAAALALALGGRVRARHAASTAGWPLRLAAAAWVLLLVSFTVHLAAGHTPGGPQALPLLEFIAAHRSFVVAALIPVLALTIRRPAATGAGDPA